MYLFSLERTSKGDYHLHSPKYLNSFNPVGYNNQPAFTHTGDLLVSVRKPGDPQNDIWQLSLSTKKFRRLTKTQALEYSPQIHPDEEHLSVLRKIGDEPLHQQVCKINLKTGQLEVVTPDLKDVGSYTWISPNALGLFRIEGTTNRLSYYEADQNKSRRITTAVGRSLASDKDGWLIYVHKFTDEYWYIKKYNPSTSAIEIITRTPGKTEDFAIASDGTIFMGYDQHLFSFHPDRGKEWKHVGDLSIFGIKFISRLAISPDNKKLVVVASKEK